MEEIKLTDNAREVLTKRYLRASSDSSVTETPVELFRRVADAVAAADALYDRDADLAATAEVFFKCMTELRFLPNSPTLMNAGRPLGQLAACFVLPVEDSMDGIFESIKQAALIHKSGGGTGFSFSRLRPAGSSVNSTGGIASGPVSFMRVFNMATEAVKQGGARRGANMGILRIDHPDILEFIDCKKQGGELTNFNISVGVTEAFMQAVEKNEYYSLISPNSGVKTGELSARYVFQTIIENAWLSGEPGIIFLDRLNRDNITPNEGEIESTNPCGEQPLLPYESCNLGSVNLAKMVCKKEDGSYDIDTELLGATVYEAVHFLDNVIDINHYPLEEIEAQTKKTRKIGLGVMGFADMLLKLGIAYDSDAAVDLADKLMEFINRLSHEASGSLAQKRGVFPLFHESTLRDGPGMRNGTVTTIAPTGTISIIADASSGIEPIFAYAYVRNVLDGSKLVESNALLRERLEAAGILTDELLNKIAERGSIAHIDEIPAEIRAVFRSSHDVSPEFHIRIQAAFQKHTDNAVSKTVNFSREATLNQVAEAFLLAGKLGCKGVTIYRDGSRDNQVLSFGGSGNAEEKQAPASVGGALPEGFGSFRPRERPEVTKGFTERVKTGCGNLYITVNYDDEGICEVFTSTGKGGGCPSQSESTARLVSIAIRSGVSVEEIYNQLKGIRCPSTVRVQGLNCTSCPDAIAKVIQKVARFRQGEAGDIAPDDGAPRRAGPGSSSPPPSRAYERDNPEIPDDMDGTLDEGAIYDAPGPTPDTGGARCPDCGGILRHESGCVVCRNCGYSKCG